jgi:hypothetical protein
MPQDFQVISQLRELCLLPQTPELEALRFDRFFDRFSRERVGRGLIRTHDPGRGPRRMIAWELGSRRIAGECPQILCCLRFENIHSHRSLNLVIDINVLDINGKAAS